MIRPLAAACAFALSLSISGTAGAIINGKPVAEGDAYAHSVVGLVPIDEKGHPGACTGILLAPQAVLTAAHCVTHTKSISAVFDLKFGDAHKVAVTRFVIHPGYVDDDKGFTTADLAVVFLAPHKYPTEVIPLDQDVDFGEGQQFIIIGYGRSERRRVFSFGVLRKAAIAAGGHDTDQAVELHPLADAWPCEGDSGGPVLRKDMSGRYFVSGVMDAVYSGPFGECAFDGSFMTPIHTYAGWIAKTLAGGN